MLITKLCNFRFRLISALSSSISLLVVNISDSISNEKIGKHPSVINYSFSIINISDHIYISTDKQQYRDNPHNFNPQTSIFTNMSHWPSVIGRPAAFLCASLFLFCFEAESCGQTKFYKHRSRRAMCHQFEMNHRICRVNRLSEHRKGLM